jgi:hypothetical protein
LRKLWPHLLNELVYVFEEQEETKKKGVKDQDYSRLQLITEAIKIVELMSCLNIEDFHMNQWIFLVDAYGMDVHNPKFSTQMPQSMTSPAEKVKKGQDKDKETEGGTF